MNSAFWEAQASVPVRCLDRNKHLHTSASGRLIYRASRTCGIMDAKSPSWTWGMLMSRLRQLSKPRPCPDVGYIRGPWHPKLVPSSQVQIRTTFNKPSSYSFKAFLVGRAFLYVEIRVFPLLRLCCCSFHALLRSAPTTKGTVEMFWDSYTASSWSLWLTLSRGKQSFFLLEHILWSL